MKQAFTNLPVWLACIAAEWGKAVAFSDKEVLACRLCSPPWFDDPIGGLCTIGVVLLV